MLTGIIKDSAMYEKALDDIEQLMSADPVPDSSEGRRLELLVHLVELYESEKSRPIAMSPVDAIQFRMEQAGLKQSDLVPFIGSRSKVSEVLSGKRPLTLSMIQGLHTGLGIPASLLIQPMTPALADKASVDWRKFPIREMSARKWIEASKEVIKNSSEAVLYAFFSEAGGLDQIFALNKTSSVRTGREMNRYALSAWTARVIQRARKNPPITAWNRNSLSLKFMSEVAHLSVLPDGPIRAQRLLWENGISLVTESSLPQTYLDGSAIMTYENHPIIGLTLRYDRVDNFWFSLMHELAHLSLHFEHGVSQFYDDLDIKKFEDPREAEADELATEALVPSKKWATSPARVAPSRNTILRFSRDINVHPGIVAGRIRREKNSYHLFNELVGHGRIRDLFGMTDEKDENENV